MRITAALAQGRWSPADVAIAVVSGTRAVALVGSAMATAGREENVREVLTQAVQDAAASPQRRLPSEALTRCLARAETELARVATLTGADRVGATFAAAWIEADQLAVAHAGHCRVHRLGDRVELLTRDHRLAEEARRAGRVGWELLRAAPHDDLITRSLGLEPRDGPRWELGAHTLAVGDIIVLTSGRRAPLVLDAVRGSLEEIVRANVEVDRASLALALSLSERAPTDATLRVGSKR